MKMTEILKQMFIKRMTVDSPHQDRRKKDFNQAIFSEQGWAVFNRTSLDMVLKCFDDAVKDFLKEYGDKL